MICPHDGLVRLLTARAPPVPISEPTAGFVWSVCGSDWGEGVDSSELGGIRPASRPHLDQSEELRRGIPHRTRTHPSRLFRGCRSGEDDAIHRYLSGRTSLLPDLTVGEFGDNVEVSEVAGVFLDQMEQDAFERCGVGTVPAGTWFAHLDQIVGLDDGSGPLGLSTTSNWATVTGGPRHGPPAQRSARKASSQRARLNACSDGESRYRSWLFRAEAREAAP